MTKKIDTPEATIEPTTETTAPKETTKMKLSEVAAKEFTPKQIEDMTASDIKKLIEVDFGMNVISEGRAEKYLVTVIRDERVKDISAQMILSLTARQCWVKGTSTSFTSPNGVASTIAGHGVPTEAEATYNPTLEEYEAYTADKLADIVDECCTKNRAHSIVLALIGGGLKVTHEDLIHLTNGRILIKGVEAPKVVTTSSNTPVEDVMSGVSFG